MMISCNNEIVPLVSFILISYNQERYIAEAIEAALSQDYEKIEFIFNDDCSKDHTFEIISELSSSSNRNIIYKSNPKNLGLAGNFNAALSLAKGDIIVVAAGDDISLFDRVSNTVQLFQNNDDISFLSFNDYKINDENEILGVLNDKLIEDKKLTLKQFLNGIELEFCGASRAFKRDIFDTFKELLPDCPTEDTPYRLRGLMLGNGMVSKLPGIKYRIHNNNLSNANNLSKMKHNLVSKQYEIDINLALLNGHISESESHDLFIWSRYIMNVKSLAFSDSNFKKIIGYLNLFFCNKFFRSKIRRRFSR
ncbi:glycosyltransferase [Shewanella sp. SM34]|uniref:glycosyltransferase family 2 protein n=1 Tax=unclassified Shewanella TaxID=196818 RepID=UPI0021DB523A|nr:MULTISPECIES: glycosyltransferase family 2 protein [unclassified Shewanella]MCU8055568.1 glycosyltransferase [Shewanella sp. SM35]MCU8064490.1 glycosyltransferase [Shewanella sp. SM34]